MKHEMKLKDRYFQSIKNGTKIYELRLYDEKRQQIKKDDIIEFTNLTTGEKLNTHVLDLLHFKNFEELYNCLNMVQIGYAENEPAHYTDMEQFYSKQEQAKYGVVAINIEKI